MEELLSLKLISLLKGRKAVVLCIGTDLFGGDCLGPLTGHMLKEAGIKVYGTLDAPITALNVNEMGCLVKKLYPQSAIIAVDSMVGTNVGRVEVKSGGLLPGEASKKNLLPVGDISITAITTPFVPSNPMFSNVRLSLVFKLARLVSNVIIGAVGWQDCKDLDLNDITLKSYNCVSF